MPAESVFEKFSPKLQEAGYIYISSLRIVTQSAKDAGKFGCANWAYVHPELSEGFVNKKEESEDSLQRD